MRASRSLTAGALVLVAACSSDALLPAPTAPLPPSAALQSPRGHLVVVDSTELPFVGTAAERSAGHYTFVVVGAAPALVPGDYVAGRQGGLFLGRVLSVAQSGGRLMVETAPASWSEVYPPFHVRIPMSQGAGSTLSPYGPVTWGPWEAVRRPGQTAPAAGARAPAAIMRPSNVFDSTLAFLLNNLDLCAASGFVSGCASITAKVLSGNFNLTGGVDLGFGFDLAKGFQAHATVDQKFNAGLDFQLTGNGSVTIDIPIPEVGFVRKFKIGPDSGQIKLGFVVGLEGDIGGTTVEPHFEVADTSTTGVTATLVDGVAFQSDHHPHFDAGAKVIALGDLGAKLSFGPTFTVEFSFPGGGGLNFDIGGDIFDHATLNLTGLLGGENWHGHVSAGVEATVDATVKVPLFHLDVGPSLTFTPLEFNVLDLWGTGDLYVTTSTTGKDVFPGQLYATTVRRTTPTDPPPWFRVFTPTFGVNETQLFQGGFLCRQFYAGVPLIPPFIAGPIDCNVVATGHTVSPLIGIAWNCTALEPGGRQVTVRPRIGFAVGSRPTNVTLSVVCQSAYAIVRDTVNAMLATGRINVGGIATAFDAKLFAAEAARDAGNPALADSALSDLHSQLLAQFGKHITTVADAELQQFDILLRTCYEGLVPVCSSVAAPAGRAAGALGP